MTAHSLGLVHPINGAHRYMTAHSLGFVHPINGAHRYMTAHFLGLVHLINGAHRYMTAHSLMFEYTKSYASIDVLIHEKLAFMLVHMLR
jgi:hypothetical protein